jgi:hypothetical protein
MSAKSRPAEGVMTLAEMKEFAGFVSSTQRYVRRSLDIGLDRDDALARWSRDVVEAASIRAQARMYDRLPEIRALVPDDSGLDAIEPFMAPLITITAFDLGQGRLTTFSAYRFLYERLIGASVRPWLPGAFCGTSTPSCGASCSSRSARRRRRRAAGRRGSRRFSRTGSRRSSSERALIEAAAQARTEFERAPAAARPAAPKRRPTAWLRHVG